MATAKLRLRSDRVTKGITKVYIQLVFKSKKSYLSTPIKIDPERWNDENGRISGNSSEVKEQNNLLQTRLLEVNTIISKALQEGKTPSLEYVKKMLLENEKSSVPEVSTSVQKSLLDVFAECMEANSSMNAAGTQKHYKTSLNHLKKFATASRSMLMLEEIDLNFYSRFIAFLLR